MEPASKGVEFEGQLKVEKGKNTRHQLLYLPLLLQHFIFFLFCHKNWFVLVPLAGVDFLKTLLFTCELNSEQVGGGQINLIKY